MVIYLLFDGLGSLVVAGVDRRIHTENSSTLETGTWNGLIKKRKRGSAHRNQLREKGREVLSLDSYMLALQPACLKRQRLN